VRWAEELHVYAPQISACNSERLVKIGAIYRSYPKNKTGYPFFGPPCSYIAPCQILCRITHWKYLFINDGRKI